MLSRAQALVSSEALRHNVELLSRHAGAPVLLPVKAAAYGHGAGLVTRVAQELPQVWGFGVATPQEAVELLGLGVHKPVLLLTPAAPEESAELAALGVRVAVSSRAEVGALPGRARAHLKINTGMNRLGVPPEEAPELAALLHGKGQLEGVMTHFATSEGPDLSSARRQLELFVALTDALTPALRHASNSGGVFSFGPQAAFDLIRPGIASYGYAPGPHLQGALPLRPVMQLQARVNHVHTVRAGEAVSYGGLWVAPRTTEVAVVGIGYADGYPRPATGKAHMRIRNELRPVLGRICMDQCMLDVTGLGARPGEWAEVLGPGELSADQLGQWAGTVSYEILTGVGPRVQRLLVE